MSFHDLQHALSALALLDWFIPSDWIGAALVAAAVLFYRLEDEAEAGAYQS